MKKQVVRDAMQISNAKWVQFFFVIAVMCG